MTPLTAENGHSGQSGLEPPPGFAESYVWNVSADGHVVAGEGRQMAGSEDKSRTAVIWDDRRPGPTVVANLLRETGLVTDLGGVQLPDFL